MPRKIGELELEFEIPTWNSNWDFEQFTIKSTGNFIPPQTKKKTKSVKIDIHESTRRPEILKIKISKKYSKAMSET